MARGKRQILLQIELFFTFVERGKRFLSVWVWKPGFYPISEEQQAIIEKFSQGLNSAMNAHFRNFVIGENFGCDPLLGTRARIKYYNDNVTMDNVCAWLNENAERSARKIPKVRMQGARPSGYKHWILYE